MGTPIASTTSLTVGESGKVDISRGVEEAEEVFEEISDVLEERQVSLKEAMERASHLEEEIESVLTWLPKLEETLQNMSPITGAIRPLKIQIEEIKILKLQAVGNLVNIGFDSILYMLKNVCYQHRVSMVTELAMRVCARVTEYVVEICLYLFY